MTDLPLKDEVYQIVGAAMEVYNVLGPGFLEAVYQEALEIELQDQGIPFVAQGSLPVRYKDRVLSCRYVTDVVCFDAVILELKALDRLSGKEEAQLLNYLKASGKRVGLLLNFGSAGGLEWKRFVY